MDYENPHNTLPRGSRLDAILLVASALSSLIFLYLLLSPRHELSSRLNAAGTINESTNVVKIRQDSDWAWFEGHKGDKIHSGDLIFTHENSKAIVDLDWGQKLRMSSNTLIKIERSKENNNSEIEIQKGQIEATLDQSSPEKGQLNFKYKGKTFFLNSTGDKKTKVQFKSEKNGGELFVLEGAAELKTAKGNVILNSENKVNISDTGQDKIEKISAIPLSPLNESTIVIDSFNGNNNQILLKWISKLKTENKNYIVEIARDSDFKNMADSKNISKEEYLFTPLEESAFYWKVKAKNENENGPVFSFNVFNSEAPNIKWNRIGHEFNVGDNIIFNIDKLPSNINIQHFVQIIAPLTSEKNLIDVDNFKYDFKEQGQYRFIFWKEFSGFKSKEASYEFTINNFDLNSSPEIQSPEDGQVDLQIRDKREQKGPNSIFITFKKIEKHFGIEIVITAQRGQVEKTVRSEENMALISLDDFGKYSIKSRNYLKSNPTLTSSWSKEIQYEVKEISRPNALPENGTRIELEKPSEKVTFSWKAPPKEDPLEEMAPIKYLFEIDDNAEFTSPDNQMILENVTHFTLSMEKPGIYFWRTKIITTTGEVIYSSPKKVEISPIPPPPAIEIHDLKLKIKFDKESSRSIIEQLKEFIISSAFAKEDEELGHVDIEWPLNKNAEFFVLQIFNNDVKPQLILEKKLTTNRFTWDVPHPGTFHYRVAIIDFWKRQGPFGRIAKIEIDYDEKDLATPEINLSMEPEENVAEENKTVNFSIGKRTSSKLPAYLQISRENKNSSFNKPILEKKINAGEEIAIIKKGLAPGKYYYRSAIKESKNGQTVRVSKVTSFVIPDAVLPPPLKKIDPVVITAPIIKAMNENEWAITYGPSKITQESTHSGKKASIEGNVLKNLNINYTKSNFTYAGPFTFLACDFYIEQGQVFDSESYLRYKLSSSTTRILTRDTFKWGPHLHLEKMTYFDNVRGVQSKNSKSIAAIGLDLNYSTNFLLFDLNLAAGTAMIFEATLKFYFFERKYLAQVGFENISFKNSGSEVTYNSFRPQIGLTYIY